MTSETVALREKGWSLECLAEKFKCHVGSISWCGLMNGVSPALHSLAEAGDTDSLPFFANCQPPAPMLEQTANDGDLT